ncbi:MAG: hypothetical protein AAGF92_06830 [Myxococcota bacterium]
MKAALPVLLLALAVAVSGCKSDEPEAPAAAPSEPEAMAAPEEEAPEAPRPSMYDANGRLVPSDDYVIGVRLPRGAEPTYQESILHVYRIGAPVERVLEFVAPQLITGSVERRGKGAMYRKASIRGAEISPTKVDVLISDSRDGSTRITITELRPPPENPPPQDQTIQRARREFERLD